MSSKIQLRRGTAAQWTSETLAAGEIGYETDTGNFKIGDGSTGWATLSYFMFPLLTSANVDLNNADYERMGRFDLAAPATTYTNGPALLDATEGASKLIVTKTGTGYIQQIVSTNYFFTRAKFNATWQAWKQLPTSDTANTVNTLVRRDASGNFAAGTITATTFTGNVTATTVSASGTTVSTNTTTGALTVVGGVGIGGALNVGGIISGTGGVVPIGGIIMWSGTIATIPSNWALCNGSSSTPDLRDKFIIGATSDSSGAKTNVTGSLTQTGGSKDSDLQAHTHANTVSSSHNITASQASHNHAITDGGHTHGLESLPFLATTGTSLRHFLQNGSAANQTTASAVTNISLASETPVITTAGSVSTSISNVSAGSGAGTNANLPPYYALAFIMRTA